jgi:predicted amidohydrolase
MEFRIALAQIDPLLGNLGRNVEKHVAMARKALDAGAHVVVFPELSLTGYSIKDMNWDLAFNTRNAPSEIRPLLDMSASISILAGGIEEDDAFTLYNSAFLFENGTVHSVHRKTYPPTYGMFEEMRYFSRGGHVAAFDAKCGRLGVLICEDLWHLPLPYILARDGAQVLIALVASPTRLQGNETDLPTATVNRENHKAYARLLSSYVVFCNRVGFEDGVNFWGGSEVLAPDGEVIASARLFEEDLVVADVKENDVRRARRFSRHFLDDDIGIVIDELTRIRQRLR